uniref:Immunoglobulin domain-containing protein n=1 Tax=Poecilia mexicana TaxID=48701 RepID=A0A3B3WLP0_9TELE
DVNLHFLNTLLFCWITKSEFEFHSVLVQPGEDVALLCPNLSKIFEHIFWYKLIPGLNVSRISLISTAGSEARLYDEFQREKFNMTSNITNFFLNIKQVNFSDSGVYICGTKLPSCLKIFSETYLQVEDGLDVAKNLPTVILGGVFFSLVIIILGLVLKTRPCHKGILWLYFYLYFLLDQLHNNLESDPVNYAALNFRPKANRNRRPAERETDSYVLYAATR